MTVSCQGTAIQLAGASPNNGYNMIVDRAGPDDVRVRFAGKGTTAIVLADCHNGTPQGGVYHDG